MKLLYYVSICCTNLFGYYQRLSYFFLSTHVLVIEALELLFKSFSFCYFQRNAFVFLGI